MRGINYGHTWYCKIKKKQTLLSSQSKSHSKFAGEGIWSSNIAKALRSTPSAFSDSCRVGLSHSVLLLSSPELATKDPTELSLETVGLLVGSSCLAASLADCAAIIFSIFVCCEYLPLFAAEKHICKIIKFQVIKTLNFIFLRRQRLKYNTL